MPHTETQYPVLLRLANTLCEQLKLTGTFASETAVNTIVSFIIHAILEEPELFYTEQNIEQVREAQVEVQTAAEAVSPNTKKKDQHSDLVIAAEALSIFISAIDLALTHQLRT